MRPDRWQKVEAFFQAAIDLQIEDRKKFLDEKCSHDSELKYEVEKLLADHDSASDFIEKPVWTDRSLLDSSACESISNSLNIIAESDQPSLIGTRIGSYQLTRELGRGGMGAVYLAERADGEFQQTVAIKLIKRGMDSDFIIKRFRHERQILASFEHPNIARLIDGGTNEAGLPYFVMEFVEGSSLYDYCDERRLDIDQRLEIFRQICSAVSYAHQKQIIHRDIKPGNIFITADGVPKLLDFGIAKILNNDLIHDSVSPTASLMRLMTPDYASPEQIDGDQITAASDIYSLGVLLYELLSGHRPFNHSGKSINEISIAICEIEPDPPSQAIGNNELLLPLYSEDLNLAAETRKTEVEILKEAIQGDLDNIIMKALAKNPAERYDSVFALSEDVENFISGRAIKAREYSVGKAARSGRIGNKHGDEKSLAVLPFKIRNLAVPEDNGDKFLGIGLADALIARLSKVKRFVVRPTSSILSFDYDQIDAIGVGIQLDVDYVLEGSIKRADERLRVTVQLLDVEKNAAVWAVSIDETGADLFSLEDAISHKVVQLLLPQLTGHDLADICNRGTENAEAFEHYLRGRFHFNNATEEGFAKALVSFHQAIAEDPDYAHAYAGIADYYSFLGIFGVLPPQECFQSAIEMAKKALELDDTLAEAHATLGLSIHGGNYDWSTAEYHLNRSLELNPNSAPAFVWFGIVRFTEGRFGEGLEFARRAIKLDPLTPFNHHNLGWGLYYARRFDESAAQYRRVISNFPDFGLGYYGLSKTLRKQGKTREAILEIENAKKVFGESVFVSLAEAESYAADGQSENALRILDELKIVAEHRYVSPYHLALVYAQLGDVEGAFASLQKAVEIKEAWLNWVGVEPVFDPLRKDKRFEAIVKFTGYDVFFGPSKVKSGIYLKSETHAVHDLPTLVMERPGTGSTKYIPIQLAGRSFRRKNLVYAAFIIVLLFAAGLVVQSVFRTGNIPRSVRSAADAQSIVIIPFEVNDPRHENLGIGFADALSSRLGYIKRLTVIAPNSGRAVAGHSMADIYAKLKAGFVVTGKLTMSGDAATVTAELVDSTDGSRIWSEQFTAADGDLFEIQSKIAEKIWNSVGIIPLPMERQQLAKDYTKNNSAYDLYLIGRYQLATRSPDNIRKAITTFKKAVEEDPGFALAYAGLADAFALLNLYEFPPPKDAYQNGKTAALKAIELDENLVEAHTSLAHIKFYGERDLVGAELEFRRAIQLNPSYSQARHWFGLLLISMNRPMDAVDEIETAAKLDPDSLIVRTALAKAYFHNKEYKAAIIQCERVLAISKDFVPAYKILRWAHLMENNYQSARAAFQNELTFSGGEINDPGWYMIVAQVESLSHDKREIVKKLDLSVEQPVVKNSPATFSYETALAYNLLGEREKAMKWLEKAESAGDQGFISAEADPRLENLKHEQRFRRLLTKLKKT